MIKSIKTLLFSMLGLGICLFGCNPETENPIDLDEIETPSIVMAISRDAEKLFNEVDISVNASGNIEKVEFFLNELLIGKDTEAPFKLLWNTKEAEDGKYMLKVIAHEASGKKGEVVREVRVKNTLLAVNIEPGYINRTGLSDQAEWLFLSDKQGNMVGEPQEVINGTSLSWKRPSDFNQDTIYFNRLYYSYIHFGKELTYLTLNTYTNFTTEEVTLKQTIHQQRESIGYAEIRKTNDLNEDGSYIYSTQVPHASFSSTNPFNNSIFILHLYEENNIGLSTFESGRTTDKNLREKYYRLDDLRAGNNYHFHTSEYTAMDEQKVSAGFDYDNLEIESSAYLKKDDKTVYMVDKILLQNNELAETKMFHTNSFPYYRTYINGSDQNSFFHIRKEGRVPAVINKPDYFISISTEDQKSFETNTRSSFDSGQIVFLNLTNNEKENTRITYNLFVNNSSGITYQIPEIPETLLKLYPKLSRPVKYEFSHLLDYEKINSYKDLLNYWFSNRFSNDDIWEYAAISIFPENAEGRKTTFKDWQTTNGRLHIDTLSSVSSGTNVE